MLHKGVLAVSRSVGGRVFGTWSAAGHLKHIDSKALAADRRKKRMKDSFFAALFMAAITVILFVCILLFENRIDVCMLAFFVLASLLFLSLKLIR